MTENFASAWKAWRRQRIATMLETYGMQCPAYAPDPRWVVTADYSRYERPRWDVVDSADGRRRPVPVHGVLRFTLAGVDCTLEPYSSGPPGTLNVAFRDATGGVTTYAAARVVFPPMPAAGESTVTLDFNRAVNPPCAFTAFAACAYPPPGNTLPIAVEAGEQAPGHGVNQRRQPWPQAGRR